MRDYEEQFRERDQWGQPQSGEVGEGLRHSVLVWRDGGGYVFRSGEKERLVDVKGLYRDAMKSQKERALERPSHCIPPREE